MELIEQLASQLGELKTSVGNLEAKLGEGIPADASEVLSTLKASIESHATSIEAVNNNFASLETKLGEAEASLTELKGLKGEFETLKASVKTSDEKVANVLGGLGFRSDVPPVAEGDNTEPVSLAEEWNRTVFKSN